MKRALITGINGQDGSYLAELLLDEGYEVHGVVRRDALEDPAHRLANIAHLQDRLRMHVGSLDNHLSTYKIVAAARPDECYHLASSSFVSYNFEDEASIVSRITSYNVCYTKLLRLIVVLAVRLPDALSYNFV